MYPLTPLKAFVHERVQEKPHWKARVERVLAGCARPPEDVVTVTDENLPAVVAELERLWPPETVPEGLERTYMRPLIFTVQQLTLDPDTWPDITDLVDRCGGKKSEPLVRKLLGHFNPVTPYHERADDQKKDFVCWPTFDFKTMCGCPHGCQYCGEGKHGKAITLAVNLEEFAETVVPKVVADHAFQKCFRLIGWVAEQAAFEPEYGAFELLNRKLASLDRYIYFHSAGDSTDWAIDLPHPDRLIGIYSVTCDKVAREIEPGSGSFTARFDAAGRLNAAGIPTRPKFKPIIPVKGWRKEYTRAVDELFGRCQPESVGLCMIMWMSVDTLLEKIGEDLLDPELLAAARAAAPELADVKTGPFPHEVRREIYRHFIQDIRRHDKEVPIYISTESRAMWDDLAEELGQNPCAFFCGCSPVALPGRKLALSEEFKYSTYMPEPSDKSLQPVAAGGGR